MMTERDFFKLVDQIKALGYDEETAAYYAEIISDTPEDDAAGLTVVRSESGEVLARLKLDLE